MPLNTPIIEIVLSADLFYDMVTEGVGLIQTETAGKPMWLYL